MLLPAEFGGFQRCVIIQLGIASAEAKQACGGLVEADFAESRSRFDSDRSITVDVYWKHMQKLSRTRYISQAGIIAAIYATATLLTMLFLQGLSWGPVQLRISEAICVVALFTPAAIPGLTIGCIIANLANTVISGVGILGIFDVLFGSTATFLGALFCWKARSKPKTAISWFVVANAVIVPAYLPLLLQGLGFYVIPFTDIAIEGAYLPMYLFGLVATGIGEAIVIYALGYPLSKTLRKHIR